MWYNIYTVELGTTGLVNTADLPDLLTLLATKGKPMDTCIPHCVTVTHIKHMPALVPFFEVKYTYQPGSPHADADMTRRPKRHARLIIFHGSSAEEPDWIDLLTLIPKHLNARHSTPFNSPECPPFTTNTVSYDMKDPI
jgi:hypothetical protein